MRVGWRRGGVLSALILAVLGFGYARPVTVFEGWAALRLRLSGVRSAHVQAGPYRLRYLEAGTGPPLVLVHGLGSSATQDWGRLIAPLGRRYHVYAPDLPGFGESERPAAADYSIPMQVEAVRAFMQAIGVGRARVAGISMGGWIVSRLAGEHPEMVERLVVVDAAGMRPERPDIPAEVLLPRDEEGVRRLVGRGAPQRPCAALVRGARHPGSPAAGGVDHPPDARVDGRGPRLAERDPRARRTCRCSSCGGSRTR